MTLTVQNMVVGYRRRTLFSSLTLPSIPSGSLVSVVGPNAVGKSTLLKSLAGILKYQGNVWLGQESLTALTQTQRMSIIGYLPQSLPQVSTLVAYETVFSVCRASDSGASLSTIESTIETVFHRLDIQSLAFQKMSEMSGGQRQMVGLAQVLVRKPKLFLLDEPTSALDLHWQLSVLQTVREEAEQTGAIVLFACHDLNLAVRHSDQLLMLSRNGLMSMGAPEDVLTTENLRVAYGIEGRVERCSQGTPIVIADEVWRKA